MKLNRKLLAHKIKSTQEVVKTGIGNYTYSRGFEKFMVGAYEISIQGSSSAYSEPRVDLERLSDYTRIELLFTDTRIDTSTKEIKYNNFVLPWVKWGHRDEKGNVVYDDPRLDIGWEGDWQIDPEDEDAWHVKTTTAGYITWEQASGFIDFLEEQAAIEDIKEWIDRNLARGNEHCVEMLTGVTKDNYKENYPD